jgi:hypothetical protein
MINVEEIKQKILEVLREKGPSIPISVSKEVNLSSLFASAILSEMISNKLIKVSNMKIGSSPLYFIQGQEAQLENFFNYLNFREKEAFSLLKKNEVLNDEKIDPIMRVATRAIKDFAIPIKVNYKGQEKLFWKFHSVEKSQAIEKIKEYLEPEKVKSKEKAEKKSKHKEIKEKEAELQAEQEKTKETKIELPIKSKKEKITKSEGDFLKKIYSYLESIKAVIKEETEKKKKSVLFKIEIRTDIGNVPMVLIAKDKKLISDSDIILAGHKSQIEKSAVLLLSSGDLNKKAILSIEQFKNLVFFNKI